jgi:hypothetical protein
MARHPASGVLCDWNEIADRGWETLLLGNGMSINVSPYFGYESLYKEANEPAFTGGLGARERAVFEAFDTTNFEVVLAKLRDGITLAEVMGRKPGPYRKRFREVQAALGRTVRRVHLEWSEVPDATLAVIKAVLESHTAIFSTSYDLLVYWAIVHGDDYEQFCDCFWANERNEFDPEDCDVWHDYTPIYYMHGALHLVVDGSGATRKLVKGDERLLDQFGKPIEDDPEARPLLISEGSPRDKLRAIEGNDYLAHIYETFKETSDPLLVFGHSLGEQDQHLIDAINVNPDRPVAISMVDEGEEDLREKQSRIWGKLRTQEVYFFDAASHPLGSPSLQVSEPRERFMGRWQTGQAAGQSQ